MLMGSFWLGLLGAMGQDWERRNVRGTKLFHREMVGSKSGMTRPEGGGEEEMRRKWWFVGEHTQGM